LLHIGTVHRIHFAHFRAIFTGHVVVAIRNKVTVAVRFERAFVWHCHLYQRCPCFLLTLTVLPNCPPDSDSDTAVLPFSWRSCQLNVNVLGKETFL
jgi:hypothetical protein